MKRVGFYYIIFTIISLIPITGYSLWIDESSTAYFASQANFGNLIDELNDVYSSETQMPGYIYFMWLWEKLFGHNEFMLRLSNLPFIVLLFAVIFHAPITQRLKIIFSCFISLSPFIWYNLNEARCTIPVFSLGGISVLSLKYYFKGSTAHKKWAIWMFSISIVLGVSFNMLFLLFIPVIGLLFIWQAVINRFKYKILISDWWLGIIFMVVSMIPLVIYYFSTLNKGAGGFKENPGIINIGFLLYEFLGFSGIGPPRNMLRDSFSLELLKPYILPIGLYFFLFILLLVFIYNIFRRNHRTINFLLNPYFISFSFGLLFFSLICSIFQFRFLGRHAAFLLPLLLFYFAEIIEESQKLGPSRLLWIILVMFFSATLVSDFNLRLNKEYKKENNREASRKAIELAGENGVIIWNGFERLAAYYGLDVYKDSSKIPESWPIKRKALGTLHITYDSELSDFLDKYRNKYSILVTFNRPEYDVKGYYRDYIEKNQLVLLYHHRDFSIHSME